MRIFCVINQKGGVGKTTDTTNLAYGLSMKGYKTLAIDLDPQGHTTMILLEKANPMELVNNLFQDRTAKIESLVKKAKSKNENLWVIGSNIKLAVVAEQLIARAHRETILFNFLTKLKGFDYVIIDCPPTFSSLTANAIYAATEYLIPVTYGRYALEGMADLFENISEVKQSSDYSFSIIRNNFDVKTKQTNMFTDNELLPFKENVLNTIIRKSDDISKAQINCETVFEFNKNGRGAQDFEALTQEIIDREKI